MEDWKVWIPLFVSVVAFLAAIGTAIWNGFQQRQIERLKSESLKSIHVHKIQFEK
jgi:hypothetical protein